MKIALGADHRGFALKQKIMEQYLHADAEWVDVGCQSQERCDYPPFAKEIARLITDKTVDAGILLCGSGIGMSIAANRHAGIYAALVWNTEVARLAKEHDNANVLVLPADFLDQEQAFECIRSWHSAVFKKDRYQIRLEMIDV